MLPKKANWRHTKHMRKAIAPNGFRRTDVRHIKSGGRADMNIRLLIAVAAIAGLAACETPGPGGPSPFVAGPPPPPGQPDYTQDPGFGPNAAFSVQDFAWSTQPGSGQIVGSLDYRAGGVSYGCQGAGVVLIPETPWSRRRMEILYLSANGATLPAADVRGRTPPEANESFQQFARRAPCNGEGDFAFTGLPDGAWYAITVAQPNTAGAGPDLAIMRRVIVRGGGVSPITLN
jgi:hypothetical protein